MYSTLEIEKRLKDLMPILATKFFVDKIGYFGSFANGEQTEDSDLDILVEFSKPVGWQFFVLEKFLEESLGIKVDLVTKNAIKKQLRGRILNQVIFV